MNIELLVRRKVFNENNCIGELFYKLSDSDEWVFYCYTLEDKMRFQGDKVKHETAIPLGEYNVQITRSNRFKRDMPLVFNTPQLTVEKGGTKFEGVRIHGGNTEDNTSGCILVAYNTDKKKIWGTAEKKLTAFLKKFEAIYLTVQVSLLNDELDNKI